jgi:hypothetical protein
VRFFGTKKFLHSGNLQATIQAAGLLQVPPKSSFKKLLLGTKLWQHAKMSTSLKSPDGLKDAECKKGQLSHRPPISYVPVVDVATPKEEAQLFKVRWIIFLEVSSSLGQRVKQILQHMLHFIFTIFVLSRVKN